MILARPIAAKVAAGLAVAALVVLVLAQARSIDPVGHSRVIANLSGTQELNSELDEIVLKVRDALLNNYDPLVATLNLIKWHRRELEQGEYAIIGRGEAQIDTAMAKLSRALEKKETLIEQFKSRTALLRNSLHYLPLAVETLDRDRRVPQAVRARAQALLRDILRLRLGATPTGSEQVAQAIGRLRQDEEEQPPIVRTELAAILSHAQNVLAYQQEQDRLVQDITAADVRDASKLFTEAYYRSFDRRLEQANLSRLALLLISVGLITYAAHSFLRLRRTAIELNQALVAQANEIAERKQTELALRHSEERLRTIADNVPVLIGYVDAEQRYRFVNKTYEHWFGRSASEYVGRTLAEIMGEEDYGRLKSFFDAALSGHVVKEERRTRSHVREQYAQFTCLPHRDADGKVLGVYVLAYDITELRTASEALRQERNLLLAIVDSLPDHVYVKDLDRRYLLINAVGRKNRGSASNDDVVGKTSFDFHPPQTAAQFDAEDQAVITTGTPLIDRERSVVNGSGERKWYLGTKAPLRGPTGDILGLIGISRDITERKQAEQALQESEERYRRLFESNPHPMWVYDLATLRFLAVNDAAVEHYGYSRDEFLAMTIKDIRPPEDVGALVAAVAASQERRVNRGLWRHRKKDGTLIEVEVTTHRLDFFGRPARLLLANDITERRRAEEQLRLVASALESAAEGVMISDERRRILFVNKAFTRITGYAPSEAIGRDPDFLRSGEHDAAFYEEVWNEIRNAGGWQGEMWRRRKDGEVYPEWRSISSVKDETGKTTHFVTVFNDVTQLKQDKERLEFLAHHDALTRLPNRTLFEDRLQEALHRAMRHTSIVGLLFIDLDHFKNINDSLGHGVGDLLLQAVTERLKGRVRQTDTVARLGGDEFAILLEELKESQNAAKVAADLLAALVQPFMLSGHELFVSASIGISYYPDDGGDPQALLKNADAAMYRAKEMGRNTYQFFSAEMNAHALQMLVMTNSLRMALERGEFFLHYQPIVDLASGKVRALEALLRWNHPELGLVPPARFIPLAEDSGLIIPIGEWVLKYACAQMRVWQLAGIAPERMAVNLSARQFKQQGLAQRIAAILGETGLASQCLELEITESMVMQDPAEAEKVLHQLHGMGIHLAIDDFGTGYSSLSYLKRFPIDFLKIDRSFVRDIPGNLDDVAITRAIVALAKSLDLRVIAEGVETEQQRAFLEAEGCDEAQGYLLSKPCSAEAVASMLQDHTGAQRAAR